MVVINKKGSDILKAVWNDKIIAESNDTYVLEQNHYFPIESVNQKFLRKSGTHYTCPWKGTCDYYDIVAGDEILEEGAWIYPNPSQEAQAIKGKVAFWRGVRIEA